MRAVLTEEAGGAVGAAIGPGPRMVLASADVGALAAVTLVLGPHAHVSAALSMARALEAVAETPSPDLVVVDVGHDDVDALCVVRAVATRRPACAIVAIVDDAASPLELVRAFPIEGVVRRPLCLHELLARMAALLALRGFAPPRAVPRGSLAMRLLQYAMGRHPEPLTIPALARGIGASESDLTHRFRDGMGVTVGQCLMRLRVEVVKLLLAHTEAKLDAVAERAGFCDAPHLCRVFRRHTGQRPGDYRASRGAGGAARRALPAPRGVALSSGRRVRARET